MAEVGNTTRKFVGETADEGKDLEKNIEETIDDATEGIIDGTASVDDIIRDGSELENGKLRPNIKYQTGEYEYIYQTNKNGLISNASTDNLKIKAHEGRLKHNS